MKTWKPMLESYVYLFVAKAKNSTRNQMELWFVFPFARMERFWRKTLVQESMSACLSASTNPVSLATLSQSLVSITNAARICATGKFLSPQTCLTS